MLRTVLLCCSLLILQSVGAQSKPINPTPGSEDPAENAGTVPSPPTFAPLPGSNSTPQPTTPLIRISGGVMAAQVLTKVAPIYPPESRANGVEGAVVLSAKIGTDGTVQNVQPVSGPPELCTAATDAVRRWTYRPYLLNGKPVMVITTVVVNFRLNDAGSTGAQP